MVESLTVQNIDEEQSLIVDERYRFDRRRIQQEIKGLSEISGLKSSFYLGLQWFIIFGSILFANYAQSLVVYVAAIVVIATRQHALAVILHDGVHYRLFRNKTINDLASDFFCAYPLAASTSLYRRFHLEHHRYTNTTKDPEVQLFHGKLDWQFPKSRRALGFLFLGDILGLNVLENLKTAVVVSPIANYFKNPLAGGLTWKERVLYGFFVGLWIALMTLTHSWSYYILFWILPTGLTSAIFRLRMISEHLGVSGASELSGTRTVRANWLERLIIAPLNVNFHLEHHLFPSVPFFNLGRVRTLLLTEHDYCGQAHVSKSYFGSSDSVLEKLISPG